MPHVIYLHSALSQSRIKVLNNEERHTVMKYYRLDVIIGMALAFFVRQPHLDPAWKFFITTGMWRYDNLFHLFC